MLYPQRHRHATARRSGIGLGGERSLSLFRNLLGRRSSSFPAWSIIRGQYASGKLRCLSQYICVAPRLFAPSSLHVVLYRDLIQVAQAIFESKFYIFCIILSNIRSLFAAQCQLSSDSADNTDLGDTILDASCILKIALALEMREPSRKNYRTKDVVAALQKEVRGHCQARQPTQISCHVIVMILMIVM